MEWVGCGSSKSEVTLTTPQIGAGLQFYFTRNKPVRSNCLPLTYTIGLGKNLGISFSDDLSNFSINVGTPSPIPITIETPIKTIGYSK